MRIEPSVCRTRGSSLSRHFAAVLLTLGFAAPLFAQPASSTWNTTISFTGTGNLDVSAYTAPGNTDPLSVSMSGTGVTTAIASSPGYEVANAFDVLANISIPNIISPYTSPFSVTQPLVSGRAVGPDPGFTLTAPPVNLSGNPSSPPFYGLFPPASGTQYAGVIANTAPHFFTYDPSTWDLILYARFNGATDLILGDAPTEVQSGNSYTFSYANSLLEFTPTVVGNDPPLVFTGTVVITTTAAAAPDSISTFACLACSVGLLFAVRRRSVRP